MAPNNVYISNDAHLIRWTWVYVCILYFINNITTQSVLVFVCDKRARATVEVQVEEKEEEGGRERLSPVQLGTGRTWNVLRNFIYVRLSVSGNRQIDGFIHIHLCERKRCKENISWRNRSFAYLLLTSCMQHTLMDTGQPHGKMDWLELRVKLFIFIGRIVWAWRWSPQ